MASLQDLIKKIDDQTLRQQILTEVNKLSEQKKFGLVFEEHLPECTPLYDMEIRQGSKVALKTGQVSDIYTVHSIDGDKVICEHQIDHAEAELALDELVAVAEFGEPIYPYLKPIDTVCNAPDSNLWHTLIEADNYHALQLLEYLYAGKVDCIYIDPPYNTGAKDWKYNNDYVDGSDAYRHSKWLSFMEKRLKLAKKLLNPMDSVLIVTIDEKEYLHLGCLLEELFPEANMQMISAMTNKKGSTRPGQFSRAGEYFFILFLGSCSISPTKDNMMLPMTGEDDTSTGQGITIWNSLLRRGTAALRSDRPNLFYPIYVDSETQKIIYVGEPLNLQEDRKAVQKPTELPDTAVVCWPMRKDDIEGRWQMSHTTLKKRIKEHRVKAGQYNKTTHQFSIVMLKDKQMEQIKDGTLAVSGIDNAGAYIVEQTSNIANMTQSPRDIWVRDTHDASIYGSTLIKGILKDHTFAFPKSLYAVQDILRFFVTNKPDALIVDFFAGSGTTLHAVNLLNAEDGGHRRCIMVTNNEVSDAEAKSLADQGYKPGDEEWERLGIARYVTWPRTVCSIEGHDVNGEPLKGSYLGSDIPMSEGFRSNAAYFKLGFLDKASVRVSRQFREMLPTLWMKAGCYGACPTLAGQEIPDCMVFSENHMAILNDNRCYAKFAEEVENTPEIETVYLVTDSDADYRSMSRGLNVKQIYQLYRDYLDNFRINSRR